MERPKKKELLYINNGKINRIRNKYFITGHNKAIGDYEKYLEGISVEKIEQTIDNTNTFQTSLVFGKKTVFDTSSLRKRTLALAIKKLIDGEVV